MRHHTNQNAPLCPDCRARHYPATLGSGERVWCGGTHAESEQEREQRRERQNARADAEEREFREQRAHERTRAALRAEHAERKRSGGLPLEWWEAQAPDTMPDEI